MIDFRHGVVDGTRHKMMYGDKQSKCASFMIHCESQRTCAAFGISAKRATGRQQLGAAPAGEGVDVVGSARGHEGQGTGRAMPTFLCDTTPGAFDSTPPPLLAGVPASAP